MKLTRDFTPQGNTVKMSKSYLILNKIPQVLSKIFFKLRAGIKLVVWKPLISLLLLYERTLNERILKLKRLFDVTVLYLQMSVQIKSWHVRHFESYTAQNTIKVQPCYRNTKRGSIFCYLRQNLWVMKSLCTLAIFVISSH